MTEAQLNELRSQSRAGAALMEERCENRPRSR